MLWRIAWKITQISSIIILEKKKKRIKKGKNFPNVLSAINFLKAYFCFKTQRERRKRYAFILYNNYNSVALDEVETN